jgi:hypothetical protein
MDPPLSGPRGGAFCAAACRVPEARSCSGRHRRMTAVIEIVKAARITAAGMLRAAIPHAVLGFPKMNSAGSFFWNESYSF